MFNDIFICLSDLVSQNRCVCGIFFYIFLSGCQLKIFISDWNEPFCCSIDRKKSSRSSRDGIVELWMNKVLCQWLSILVRHVEISFTLMNTRVGKKLMSIGDSFYDGHFSSSMSSWSLLGINISSEECIWLTCGSQTGLDIWIS